MDRCFLMSSIFTGILLVTKESPPQLQTEQDSKNLKPVNKEEILKILGPDASDAFKPTHDYYDLVRREDGIASAIIDILISFITGEHFKTVIDVNEELDDTEGPEGQPSERKSALQKFNEDKNIRRYKRGIDLKNKELNVHANIQAILAQKLVFGRPAWLNELDPKTGLLKFF